jgi:two-component system sensor histidine kinase/response regulator
MSDEPSPAPAPTILIADDNPTNLNVLIDYLSDQGYRVLVAEDGAGAIEQAQYGTPDLILLDVMMPGIDGFETCQRLKQAPETRDIPVIFMTAISDTPYILQGFSVGAVDYITKPLQREEVHARVRTHVSIRLLQRQLESEIAVRRQAEEALRETNAGKDIFLSILAHDLRNPMGGLLALSEALVEMLPAEAAPDIRETAGEDGPRAAGRRAAGGDQFRGGAGRHRGQGQADHHRQPDQGPARGLLRCADERHRAAQPARQRRQVHPA